MTEWMLVPREPTVGMLADGERAMECLGWERFTDRVWKAMIDAAPLPPNDTMTPDEARAGQRWAGMDGAIAWHLIERHADGWGEVGTMMNAWLDANRAAPQMTDADMDDAIKRDEAEQERAHVAYLRGVAEGKRQAAAPQQAEPVAWMAFGGSIVHAVTRNAMDPIEAERFDVPLYLHPPAAEVQRLRDAARAVLQEYSAHGGLRPSSMNPLIIDLHRAMEGKQC